MTHRQGNAILAGIFAVLLMQAVCTVAILRGQDQARRSATAAEASALDVLEMQKKAAGRPSLDNLRIADDGNLERKDDPAATWRDPGIKLQP